MSSNHKNAHSARGDFSSNQIAKRSQITQKTNCYIKGCCDDENEFKIKSLKNAKEKDFEIIFEGSHKIDIKDVKSFKEKTSRSDLSSKKVMCEDYTASEFTNNRKSKEIDFNLEALKESYVISDKRYTERLPINSMLRYLPLIILLLKMSLEKRFQRICLQR